MTPETLSAVLRESARVQIQPIQEQARALLEGTGTMVTARVPGAAICFGDGGSADDRPSSCGDPTNRCAADFVAGDQGACTPIILASGTPLEPC